MYIEDDFRLKLMIEITYIIVLCDNNKTFEEGEKSNKGESKTLKTALWLYIMSNATPPRYRLTHRTLSYEYTRISTLTRSRYKRLLFVSL